MTNLDISRMSTHERKAWDDIQRWKLEQSRRRGVVPAVVQRKARELGARATDMLKDAPLAPHVVAVVDKVLSAGHQAVADAVAASLRRERILRSAREAGADVAELADLRDLDLQIIDEILPTLSLRYASASAMTGAASGFVAGGGTAAIAGTAGVAAAPGALAIAGSLGADIVATIGLAARVVTHYAGYYGYDTREEDEKAVMLAVISAGVAGEGAAKQAALLHVRQVAMMVARRATWKELGEEAIVKLIQRLFTKLSVRLTQRKLAQALPVAGITIGAGLNYTLMRQVGTAASFMYRERFLIEKYSLYSDEPTPDFDDLIDIDEVDEMIEAERPEDSGQG